MTSAPLTAASDLEMLQQALLAAQHDPHVDADHALSLDVQIAWLAAHRLSLPTGHLLDCDAVAVATISSLISGNPFRSQYLTSARAYSDGCEQLVKDFVYYYDLDATDRTEFAAFFKVRDALEDQSSAAVKHYHELRRSIPSDDLDAIAHDRRYRDADNEGFEDYVSTEDAEAAAAENYAAQIGAVMRAASQSTLLTRELLDLLAAHGYTVRRGWRWGRGGSFSRHGTVSVYHASQPDVVYDTSWDTGAKHLPPVGFRCGKPHHQALLRTIYFALMHARRIRQPVDLTSFAGEVGQLDQAA